MKEKSHIGSAHPVTERIDYPYNSSEKARVMLEKFIDELAVLQEKYGAMPEMCLQKDRVAWSVPFKTKTGEVRRVYA